MRVWIDQDECLNSGQCEETAPLMFTVSAENVGSVKADGVMTDPPACAETAVPVAPGQEANVRRAAHECPARCIHIV